MFCFFFIVLLLPSKQFTFHKLVPSLAWTLKVEVAQSRTPRKCFKYGECLVYDTIEWTTNDTSEQKEQSEDSEREKKYTHKQKNNIAANFYQHKQQQQKGKEQLRWTMNKWRSTQEKRERKNDD